MEIKVLGGCCKRSQQMFKDTKEAAAKLGLTDTVEEVSDHMEIMQYGVMSTPALVVNGKVLSSGRVLAVQDISNLLAEANKA